MADAKLVDRLAALPKLSGIPRTELEWLVEHGQLVSYESGSVIAPMGKRIEYLYIMLSGHMAIRVDRGAGPRLVAEWRAGDISGMLPYSRMKGPPGDTYLEERSEALAVHEKNFPEMINRCPVFTAQTVHIMLDRARSFNTSDLQDEKMISLGKLAAGLAHELNNPASATVRSATLLLDSLKNSDIASRALGGAGLTGEMFDAIENLRTSCLVRPAETLLSPIEQADRYEDFAGWLKRHQLNQNLAAPLADTAVTVDALETLAGSLSGNSLEAALQWIAFSCTTHSLATEIQQAATRIYELVAAVKQFTYMDNLAGPEQVDVESGIRDTLRIVAAKMKEKEATVTLEIEPGLPRVHATGGELNQIWLNLIDNALDAIPKRGSIEIIARRELDRVVVRVVDNGSGIPSDIMAQIYDPFFTTKPPGQGTGLGLDITRRLLRRFQGDISVQSRPGHTEFRISLIAENSSHAPVDQAQKKQ